MGLSWAHILIVLVLFILLFGRGKISDLMGDVAKGIKSFKQGLADEPEAEPEPEILRAAPKTPPKAAPKTIGHMTAIEHKKTAPAPRSRKAAGAKPKTTGKGTGKTTGKTTRNRTSG